MCSYKNDTLKILLSSFDESLRNLFLKSMIILFHKICVFQAWLAHPNVELNPPSSFYFVSEVHALAASILGKFICEESFKSASKVIQIMILNKKTILNQALFSL